MTLEQAVALIPDGAAVAIGGAGLERKPMAMVRALAQAGRRDLRVLAFLGSVDVELLLAAGCVGELHSAGVALGGAGLAPWYRAARQQESVRFVEWSEGTFLCALEAGIRGVPSLPTWMGLGTDLPTLNPWLRPGQDPFTGEPVMNVRALDVDAALIHVPAVDAAGNAYAPGDLGADGLMARAARHTIVTYESLSERRPEAVALSRIWIEETVAAPGGSWPTGCHPSCRADLDAIARWAKAGTDATPESL